MLSNHRHTCVKHLFEGPELQMMLLPGKAPGRPAPGAVTAFPSPGGAPTAEGLASASKDIAQLPTGSRAASSATTSQGGDVTAPVTVSEEVARLLKTAQVLAMVKQAQDVQNLQAVQSGIDAPDGQSNSRAAMPSDEDAAIGADSGASAAGDFVSVASARDTGGVETNSSNGDAEQPSGSMDGAAEAQRETTAAMPSDEDASNGANSGASASGDAVYGAVAYEMDELEVTATSNSAAEGPDGSMNGAGGTLGDGRGEGTSGDDRGQGQNDSEVTVQHLSMVDDARGQEKAHHTDRVVVRRRST